MSSYLPDFGLHISLFYREALVKQVVTSSPEGCQITSYPPASSRTSSSSSSSSSSSPSSPCSEERQHSGGGAEVVLFPFPFPESQRQGADKLPDVLEKGVVLWMDHDGLYAKRLCQGRVYWEGPLSQHKDKPNKLEKEHTCKLLDTQLFLTGMYGHIHILGLGVENKRFMRESGFFANEWYRPTEGTIVYYVRLCSAALI